MIDPTKEELILLKAAVAYYPRDGRGRKPHVSTVFRHASAGTKGVVLETIRTPRLCTSREAVRRFFERLSQQVGSAPPAAKPAIRVPNRRVEEELDRLGL